MKLLCILLSVYVLLLSVRPCCADDCTTTMAQKAKITKCAATRSCTGCSPFYSCGSCAGFVVAKTMLSLLKPSTGKIIKHCSAYQQPYPEEITFSIWQPPQLS